MKEQVRNHISDRTIANPSQVIEYCRAQEVQMVDFRFTDLPGSWQHFSIPVGELDESMFVEGVGFDGSSIRGFQHINESDM
ncbi:MAG TPA: glutamine synthetase, partial [bacterium]|nr:glutamine synthetase [bacterium]